MSYLNSITLVGFVGSDAEQRQAKGNGSKFTVLSVATQRSWKNADAPSKPTSLIHSTSLSTLSVGPDADTFPKFSSSTDTTPMPTCSTTAPCSWPSRITYEHR